MFLGFNRYMVECEFFLQLCRKTFILVLIDTWWNVNERIGKIRGKFAGFNRYMVECELSSEDIFFLSLFVLIDTWWNVN